MKGKTLLGWGLLLALGAWTGWTLFRGQSAAAVWRSLRQVHPLAILAGVALMAGFLLCEALCLSLIHI